MRSLATVVVNFAVAPPIVSSTPVKVGCTFSLNFSVICSGAVVVVSATGVDPTSLAWACACVASSRVAAAARNAVVVFFGIVVSSPRLSRSVARDTQHES